MVHFCGWTTICSTSPPFPPSQPDGYLRKHCRRDTPIACHVSLSGTGSETGTEPHTPIALLVMSCCQRPALHAPHTDRVACHVLLPEANRLTEYRSHLLAARAVHAASLMRRALPMANGESSPCRIHTAPAQTSPWTPWHGPMDYGLSYGPESQPTDNTSTTASPCIGTQTWRTPRPSQSTWPPSSNACCRHTNGH